MGPNVTKRSKAEKANILTVREKAARIEVVSLLLSLERKLIQNTDKIAKRIMNTKMSRKTDAETEQDGLLSTVLTPRAKELLFRKMTHLCQQISKTSRRPSGLFEALSKTYEQLGEDEKLLFLLSGGVPQLVRYQLEATEPDQATGELPVPC